MEAVRSLIAEPYDVAAIRRDFPILSRRVYGEPLVYLDNGASAQKPLIPQFVCRTPSNNGTLRAE